MFDEPIRSVEVSRFGTRVGKSGKGKRRYRFRHVTGNAELEAKLAQIRAEAAAQGPAEKAAIEAAEAKREARRQKRLRQGQ